MLGCLIRKEILDHILSLRFLILSVIAALVVLLSLYSGYTYYQSSLENYRLAETATENRIRQLLDCDDWLELDAMGFKIHKPPTPMSIFVRGLEPALGRTVLISGGGKQLPARSPESVEPSLGVFPLLDLGLIVQIVVSLFILLLTFDVVCGEKENGTLRLIAALPISKAKLLLGKFLGVLIPTLASIFLPLLLGLAAVLMSPHAKFTELELIHLVLILLTIGTYLCVFTSAGIFASCLAGRSATAFVVLLSFWVATVIVLPRLSLIVADSVSPAPSFYNLITEKAVVAMADLEARYERHRNWQQDYQRVNGIEWHQTPEGREAYQLFFAQTRREARTHTFRQWERLDEAFQNRYNARLDLAMYLARLSPTFAFNNAVVRLAGVGWEPQHRFKVAGERFWKKYRAWFARTKTRDRLRLAHPAKYGEYVWDVSDMPRFIFHERSHSEDLRFALVDVGILALWGIMFFAGAFFTIQGYDVR